MSFRTAARNALGSLGLGLTRKFASLVVKVLYKDALPRPNLCSKPKKRLAPNLQLAVKNA